MTESTRTTARAERHVVVGAGPLGVATAQAIATTGVPVTMLSRTGAPSDDAGIRALSCDIRDPAQLAAAFDGATVVYQCAQPPYTRWREEFESLQRAVLDAAQHAGARVVIADNMYSYGHVRGIISEDTPARPTSTKGEVRARMAADALALHASGRLEVTIVRGSDFYGPGVHGSALGERVWAPLVDGEAANVAGNPDLPHTYTYIRDFARALQALGASSRGAGEVWHAPNAPTTSTRALLQQAARILARPVRLRATGRRMMQLAGLFVPEARETVEMMYEFENAFIVSSDKITEAFGLTATPVVDAVDETIAWYRAQNR